jgi:hypothetical protein
VKGPWADEEVLRNVQSGLTEAGASFTSVETLPAPETGASYERFARELLGAPRETDSPEVIVFVGGGAPPEDTPEEVVDALTDAEREMFEVWTEAGVRVVAAEASTTDRSEVPLFQDAGIPSVDNADRAAGRAAVVHLAGNLADGSYGTKPTASRSFPPATS